MPRPLARFHLYRYQLLPLDRYFQGDLYGPKTIEDLLARKNEILADALRGPGAFMARRAQTVTQALATAGDFLLYRIAANRSLQHETRQFTTEVIDNWPKILVVIWNAPDKQIVAVQHRSTAFQDTTSVLKLIFEPLEPVLSRYHLTALWEAQFEKKVFWDLIDKYAGKVQGVDFELITPNMANISGVLPGDLRDFAKRTNAIKSKVALTSGPASSLKLERNDAVVSALVEYSSEGGGDIALRLAGIKKTVHTSRTVREITIDEAALHGSADDVAKLLRELLT